MEKQRTGEPENWSQWRTGELRKQGTGEPWNWRTGEPGTGELGTREPDNRGPGIEPENWRTRERRTA